VAEYLRLLADVHAPHGYWTPNGGIELDYCSQGNMWTKGFGKGIAYCDAAPASVVSDLDRPPTEGSDYATVYRPITGK
jgi:hypothetical protein